MKSNSNMFSRLWRIIFGVSFIFLFISATSAFGFFGGKITSFSADWVMTLPDSDSVSTSKLYVTPEAYRMDGMPMGAGQQGMPKDMTILAFKDQNRQYMYNHDKKLVYESEIDEQETMDLMKSYQNVDSEEILGKETVSGYTCTKKKVTTTTTMMGMRFKHTSIIWQSDKFEMPLRVQGEEGNISELRNISTRKPSADLFKPLSGYTKVDNMMAVMGIDFGREERQRDRKTAQESETEEEAGVSDMIKDAGKGFWDLIGR